MKPQGLTIDCERQQEETRDTYRLLFESMLNGFALHEIICDPDGKPEDYRFLAVNPAFERMTGMRAADVVGRTVREIMPETEPMWIERYGRVALNGEAVKFEEFSHMLARHFKVAAFCPQPGRFAAVFEDITEQKASEARIARLTQFYAALSQCNQAIVNSASTEELLPKVCRVAVEFGGMKMAWIGMVDEADGMVRVAALSGSGTEYLDGLEISIDAENPLARGPTGTAIREKRPVWCQDFQGDPATLPWHEKGGEFGWRASASLPLTLRQKPIGALTLYSDTLNAFDEDARNLLVEMAGDIDFALESFARQEDSRKAEAEANKLRTAVEQSANTIVITDPSGIIEYVNPFFEKTTGYSFAEAVGKNPKVLKSGEQDDSFYRNLWETISSGQIWRGQFHNQRKDGSLLWESATISPVFDNSGRIVHYIAVKEDITERKALEANLLDALDRAEAGNRAKSEFLAVMSHELRTPLNGVLGFAELLSESPLDNDQREQAHTIRICGEHLLQIVNDVLDFSSIERKRMRFEPCPVLIAGLVESACLPIRNTAAAKGLEFHCEMEPGVPEQMHGDERRIRQILINLLGNAVKFTSSGSVILRVAPASCGDRPALDFSVEDTGPGIPSGTIPLLFKPFTQGDSTLKRSFEGTGLGLAISQRLAEAMGGKVSVASTPGRGSTFSLRLPVECGAGDSETAVAKKVPRHVPASPGTQEASSPGNLVLVVEDDAPSRLLAGKMLQAVGWRAEFARDGQAAVDAFAPGKFSAIFMDMQMPVMDGITATKMIRETEADTGLRVPIIALTANVMPGDRERCLAAGMDDFLSKPFKKEDLAARLATHRRA
ncbi:MAG: PAS domain S-box protein [Terrimicrobiaceae bacterium]